MFWEMIPGKHSWWWESEIRKKKADKGCYQTQCHCGHLGPNILLGTLRGWCGACCRVISAEDKEAGFLSSPVVLGGGLLFQLSDYFWFARHADVLSGIFGCGVNAKVRWQSMCRVH